MTKLEGILGVYVGNGKLSLAMCKGNSFESVWVDVPDNIAKGEEIVSRNLLAQLIKDTMKQHGFRTKKAAYVAGNDKVLIKDINMPKMDDEQIRVNLPYEFREYIQGDLKEYLFDYAIREKADIQEDAKNKTEDLLAMAIPTEYYEAIRDVIQLAGLKLVKVVPELYVLENMLMLYPEEEQKKERCFLDIGETGTRMQIFKNGRFKLAHLIDIGETYIIRAIADAMNVDIELARTYMREQYQDCGKLESVINSYRDISLEVIKGFNYYEMSDMSSRLNDVVVYGSGAMIGPLVEIIKERLGKNVLTFSETFPEYDTSGNFNITASAIGVLFGSEKEAKKKTADRDGSSINFASQKKEKTTNWKALLGCIAAMFIAALLISKFAIVNRYDAVYKAESEVQVLQAKVDMDKSISESSPELAEQFYHNTWTDMTESEMSRIRRLTACELIELIGSDTIKIKDYNVRENLITVDITTDTLANISKLSEALNEKPEVESVSVASAKKEESEEVIANDGAEESEDGVIPTTTLKTKKVEAQVKIYMKSLDTLAKEREASLSAAGN